MNTTDIRVAVIGLGSAGSTLHLPALGGVPGTRVVGAVDVDPSRRARATERFRIPTFAAFDELVAHTRPDVVIIATPPDTHVDYCLRAFDAGAHVICEKPFVATVTEADRVLAAASAAGRQIGFNHQFRAMPIFRALLQEVGRVGREAVTFVQVWQLMDLAPWMEPGWRGQLLERTLFEAGIHLLDLVVALFGEIPRQAQASISTGGLRDEPTDAVAVVTLEFSRGRLAQIVQNRLCRGEQQYFEVRTDTTDASLRASFGGRARLTGGLFRSVRPHVRLELGVSGIAWRERGTRRTKLASNGRDPGMIATRDTLRATIDAFRTGTTPPIGGTEARALTAVIAACYRSAGTGCREAVDV